MKTEMTKNQIAWQGAISIMVSDPNRLSAAEIARQVAARCTKAGFEVPKLQVMARFANRVRSQMNRKRAEHPVAPLGCWGCLRARKARPYNGREKAIERAFLNQGKDYSRKAAKR